MAEKGNGEQLLSISTTGSQTKEQPAETLNLRTKGTERQMGVMSEELRGVWQEGRQASSVRTTEEGWEKRGTDI